MFDSRKDSHDINKPSISVVTKISLVLLLLLGVYFISPYGISYATSESMEPSIQKGEGFLYTEVNSIESVQQGDVITFYSETLDKRVTHRVVDKNSAGLVTQGDNNSRTDQNFGLKPVDSDMIIGKAVVMNEKPVTFPFPVRLFEFITQNILLSLVFIISIIGVIDLSSSVLIARGETKMSRDRMIFEFAILLSMFTIFIIGITSRKIAFNALKQTEKIQFGLPDSPFVTYLYKSPTEGVTIASSNGPTVTLSIPPELINQSVTIQYFAYPNVLPQPILQWLFDISPILAIIGSSIPILIALWGLLYAIFGGETIFRFD